MPWIQFRLETSAEQAPRCEAILESLGAAAVTLEDNADQPLFDPGGDSKPLWLETRVTGLFAAGTDTEMLRAALPGDLREACRYSAELLEDKDWEREWMQHYAPMQVAENLWICPGWLEPPDPGATNILLDPGLAFGTGTHPTTAMCLEVLATLPLAGRQVTDFGCGSGILAIGALLLGARAALAVDTDPQALVATRSNAERNGIELSRLQVCDPDQLRGDEQADVVVANILAAPLVSLADTLCKQLRPGGRLVLSGVFAEQVPLLRQAYPLELAIASEREGWVALSGECP